MKLTDNEIRDINRYLEEGKPLPEKYRFLLFEDKREVELVWNGKTSEVCNVVLPFQVIEQMDYVKTITVERLKKFVGKTSKELVKICGNIAKNSFLNWYVNSEMPEEAINDFIEIGKAKKGLDKQKKLLAELLNKNQLYVNFSEINDKDFNVSEEDKELNRLFYGAAYNG